MTTREEILQIMRLNAWEKSTRELRDIGQGRYGNQYIVERCNRYSKILEKFIKEVEDNDLLKDAE